MKEMGTWRHDADPIESRAEPENGKADTAARRGISKPLEKQQSKLKLRATYARAVFALGLLVSIVVCCRFCPRVAIWKGLHIPAAQHYPEVQRANFVLQQEAHPLDRIVTRSSRGAEWRLLIPAVGHLFHLPPTVILMFPQLGCLLTVIYIVHVFLREGFAKIDAFFAAVLLTTVSWFFVSMDWLGYADSWCTLGLVVIAFGNWRTALALTCLLAPWIDERFVLGVPLAIMVRVVDRGWGTPIRREVGRDVVVILVSLAPCILVRLIALLADSSTSQYLHIQYQHSQEIHLSKLVYGLWEGIRFGWIYVIFVVWHFCSRAPARTGIVVLVIFLGTAALAGFVADDLSRNTLMFTPIALLGILVAARDYNRLARFVAIACVTLNLIVPAKIVVTAFSESMANVLVIIAEYRNPPDEVNAMFYNANAIKLWNDGKVSEAADNFEIAYKLDPTLPLARLFALRAQKHPLQTN